MNVELLLMVGTFFFFKLPEKLLFSQGCNWIQQYSFGPEKYTGSNVFGKLRKCVELLKTQVSGGGGGGVGVEASALHERL